MTFMYRWGRLGIAAFALSGVSGCGARPATLSNSSSGEESLTLRQLPDVPGCDAVTAVSSLRTVTIDGQPNLYLVTDEGKPLCIDDSAGIAAFESRSQITVTSAMINVPRGEADSNPMPCRPPGEDPIAKER